MNNKVSLHLSCNAIIKLDQLWAQAHKDLDLKIIEDILSDVYQQIQADGSILDKQDLLDSYSSGVRFWEIAESTDHHVQVINNLAIMFGRWWGKGVNAGENFDYRARFLSIYRLEASGWKMILDLSVSEG